MLYFPFSETTPINKHANALVGMGSGQRHEFTREMLDRIDKGFNGILTAAVAEVFDGD